jgi:predicted nicotinamide N-methyase
MAAYLTKLEHIAVSGVGGLRIRSLLDRQQFSDPLGQAAALGISSATWPLFGLLWPSGAVLAERMVQHLAAPGLLAGARILEIGCGLALASLVGHRGGADVTASDCHPLAGRFLRANLRLNRLPPMKYRHGDWDPVDDRPGAPPDPRTAPLPDVLPLLRVHGRYDLIIGSDVLYDRDASLALAGFIERHAQPRAEVWIVDPDRGNRPAFTRCLAGADFDLHQQHLLRPALAALPAYKGRLLTYRRPGPDGTRAAQPQRPGFSGP